MGDSRTHTPTPETRTVHDPFTGTGVEVSNNLTDRLRGKYACGPHLPNGDPEFGWRQFQATPINLEAAAEIERLRASHDGLVEALRDLVALREYGDEADALRADMSGPDGPMIQWAEVEQRVWANARRALAALSGIKTTEGTDGER